MKDAAWEAFERSRLDRATQMTSRDRQREGNAYAITS